MKQLLKDDPSDEIMQQSFKKMLDLVLEFYNADHFWTLYQAFIQVVFDKAFLLRWIAGSGG